jgi:hypothetical protein
MPMGVNVAKNIRLHNSQLNIRYAPDPIEAHVLTAKVQLMPRGHIRRADGVMGYGIKEPGDRQLTLL